MELRNSGFEHMYNENKYSVRTLKIVREIKNKEEKLKFKTLNRARSIALT